MWSRRGNMSAPQPTARTGRPSSTASRGPITVELSDLDVAADRNLAYSHSIQHVAGTDKQGKKLDLTVRVTDVYKKARGRWFIVHEHVSVPVDLDAGKPDLASKP